ncbi:PREDICTED: polyadenylate-binding protein-interacting protein 3-like isoform X2 [Ipomoea nil]|uniref:polyadenylate-binding protein-interacting protein 3-like isoform X2 n=1 Tax=Ipomoea nil TaxID=35883 RepID=UPI00090162CE|nr:PREDICTED: polyadenylate-binding protein-interacting protein 3-like isoform X2 [Ipomoea nil]
MNMQPVVQTRSSANGFGRRRTGRETGIKLQSAKTNSSRLTSVGQKGDSEIPSRDRLVYITACLIGHQVEVQMLDGSVFSGILHATDTVQDFGIVLKMARLIKDSSHGPKSNSQSLSKPSSKTFIIPSKELVQITAKDVPVTSEGFKYDLQQEAQLDLMTDSCISQSRQVEVGRELERWVPDSDAPECPELDNIFDEHWNRGWDQFEANETLFGVKSTFNEELYTTKLERGSQTRELEREALRIAREIEGEETRDLHLAEERGHQLHGHLEIDEETRFSSVFRGVDDSGYDDCEEILLDSCNDETFQGISNSVTRKSFIGISSNESDNGAQCLSRTSTMDEAQSSLSSTSRDVYWTGIDDQAKQLSADHVPITEERRAHEIQPSGQEGTSSFDEDNVKQMLAEEGEKLKPEDVSALHVSAESEKINSSAKSEGAVPSKTQGIKSASCAWPSADAGGTASLTTGTELSRSSSVSSLSSEKSTLNPYAKEFKLNPNAKSFVPSPTPLRPASPVSDGSLYYPANVAAVPHMQGMTVGIGIAPPFTGYQPYIYNQQVTPAPQPYYHPNGPQYGQQMLLGHPRQVMYMPNYPHEMPHKGRDF